ncbi:Nascent polypeptide-associated complex subunit beta [Camellia lanceoleosa]|uniref:Nascent polypeptide-associated complex subunit beta n=1 Tax=Camellia lanceoleosa TaxID=1840588 RepID=A0ACC0G2F8_9ERIC|nr:Nascent polypeptide-associated complex subunit beta [Camellia lanceoleosa]
MCWTNEKVEYEMDMVESAVKSLRSLSMLMPQKKGMKERDELRKDIEQFVYAKSGPGYLLCGYSNAFSELLSLIFFLVGMCWHYLFKLEIRMHCEFIPPIRTAGLEQEIEKKLNLQEELSEAYRIKGQLADLHAAEVSKNMEAEKQVKFFQGCVASAFAERDHSIMEVGDPLEKAALKGIEWSYKSDEKAMPKKFCFSLLFVSVQASIAANTWVVGGSPQTKKLQDILPGIINQLGLDNLDNLRKFAEQFE